MKLTTWLTAALSLLTTATIASPPDTSSASDYPLFSPKNASLPFLHTSLATLLPILPQLAPPPHHTLTLTLATPAFKPLLYNWLCFLRYRAKWGQPASTSEWDDDEDEDEDEAAAAARRKKREDEKPRTGWEDVPKVLVVTSDENLALELSQQGVVVWFLSSINLDALLDLQQEADEEESRKIDRALQDDLFLNARLLDLLLPASHNGTKDVDDESDRRETNGMLPWGTLQYQSLMLERTLVMSTLIGTLVESQKLTADERERKEKDWYTRAMAHNWEESRLERDSFTGIKGVLLVDNDAVWLSSPAGFLSHPYRPEGTYPSILFASDMSPTTSNSWGTHSMPCACFIYSRTANDGAETASSLPPTNPYEYDPAEGAAQVWRWTALCHLSMLLQSLENAQAADDPYGEVREGIANLHRAIAPSFQATSLGPAMFLAEREVPELPPLDHSLWMEAMNSGSVTDLMDLLWDAGLDTDEGRVTCDILAKRNHHQSANPVPPNLALTSLTAPPHRRKPHSPVRTETLPYELFPPGMRYFKGGMDDGVKPCVVHANYATGQLKEQLLQGEGLWALRGGDAEGWTCDAKVLKDA